MTTAKPHHLAARRLLIEHLDMHPGVTVNADLDPAEVGVVGDTSHIGGGDSYHLGKNQIKTWGHRYSVDESSRDKRGLDDFASGVDVGYFKVTTVRGTFTLRDYSVWLVGLCKAHDPDTLDLREVIYSPDGVVVHRWDREGVRTSGDLSHREHTHHSEYRDADGHRMLRLAVRWLRHIGLIPEEDDMPTAKELLDSDVVPNPEWRADAKTNPNVRWEYAVTSTWSEAHAANLGNAAILAQLKVLTGHDFVDEQAIIAGVLAGLPVEAIAAAIPDGIAAQLADLLAARLQA